MSSYDFTVYHERNIAILTPLSRDGVEWADDSLIDVRPSARESIPVERRYIEPICHGILEDGLTIMKDGMQMFAGPNGELYLRGRRA